MKVLKAGVVGLGMGRFHLRKLNEHPNFEIAAICDIDEEKLKVHCEQYNAPGYTDYDTMIREAGLDLVVIASPTHFHHDHAVYAMEHGVDVFLEKPMASTYAAAQDIARVQQETGRKLMIYQPHRTFSLTLAMQDVLKSGKMGKIYLMKRRNSCFFKRNSWQAFLKNGGGTLFNRGAHHIDELLFLSGGNPEKISSELIKVLAMGDADDFFKVMIRTDNKILLDAEMNMSTPINCVPWEVYGDRGCAIVTTDSQGREVIRTRYFVDDEIPEHKYQAVGPLSEETVEYPWEIKDYVVADYTPLEIYDKCYAYYALDEEPFVPVADTLKVMYTLETAAKAAGPITDVEKECK